MGAVDGRHLDPDDPALVFATRLVGVEGNMGSQFGCIPQVVEDGFADDPECVGLLVLRRPR